MHESASLLGHSLSSMFGLRQLGMASDSLVRPPPQGDAHAARAPGEALSYDDVSREQAARFRALQAAEERQQRELAAALAASEVERPTLIRRLGRGSYGTVWSAERGGEKLAVKIISMPVRRGSTPSLLEPSLGIAGGIPGSRAQFLGPRGDDGGALGRLERRDGGEREGSHGSSSRAELDSRHNG